MPKKSKVISSSSKQFVHPGGTVHVTNPVKTGRLLGTGLGKGAKSVGKQTAKAARPR